MPPHLTTETAPRVQDLVTRFTAHYRAVWRAVGDAFPSELPGHSPDEQERASRETEEFLERTFAAARQPHAGSDLGEVKTAIRSYMLGSVHGRRLPALEEFINSAQDFLHESRAFDPAVPAEDIHQALRNVWIINSIQVCLEQQVRLSPSAFAYSLLYPYPDNVLDDPATSREFKMVFLREVRRRLADGRMDESTPLGERISKLISMIEEEFPRSTYPRVIDSLLAIHRGQERSILEQGKDTGVDEILDISLEKGGTSVLADAYLTAGDLSREMAEFSFGFGAALQFIDDLQDREVDVRNGHRTVFSGDDDPRSLERSTNRLFRFVQEVLSPSVRLFSGEALELSDLSRRSCLLLMFEAIAQQQPAYPPAYVRRLGPYSPLGMEYLCTLKSRLRKRYEGLRSLLEGRSKAAAARSFRKSRMRTNLRACR